ncbi:2-(3-amino-3-carboxypropyl)histidine synthase subunit [Candidatus Woesearchaeota archaeon]|nr:2-(3-amino-3-carboxypropyl)histidine synthase subunit [Candidatus Woesearchaeota archaeon]
MEIFNIEAKYKGEIRLPKSLIEELPNKIMVATTVQFIDFLPQIQSQLKGKDIYLFKSRHGLHPGQILGCDNFKVRDDIEAFLYIGDGLFHPKALLVNQKPVYIYNPLSEKHTKLSVKEINEYKIKKKVQLSKFLSADKIGVIVSSKPGQYALTKALELKDKLQHQKEVFLFIADNIDLNELENFPFIDAWVNTACPRIELLHIDELE